MLKEMEQNKLPKMAPFEEKVWKYLKERTTPASTKQIAKYFIRSDSHVSSALSELIRLGLIEQIKSGSLRLYKVKL